MSDSQKVNFKNFSWLNFTKADEETVQYLQNNYKFHPLDLKDCLSETQRTKVDIYPDYLFLVVIFPKYKERTREIIPAEIDIFISKKYLITLAHEELQVFSELFNLFRVSDQLRKKYPDNSPERLLYEILNKLFLYCLPMIDHIILDCDNIEKEIFSGREKRMISEILAIRRNITDFRKIMQVHKNVLKKIILNLKENPQYVMKKTDVYFESLIDYTKEIWDTLENLKERIEALQQSNESQISFRLSDIMRILTIISVITFPLTLIATLFGMNVIGSMPFSNHPFGFWIIIGIIIIIITTMLTIFKKKRWL